MLIVEGPDGVGKTTLCKKLLAKLPGHVYSHFTRLPAEFDYHWGYAERVSRHVVQDRFHMSEVAYAPVRGKVTKLNHELYRLVDARLRLVGAFTVLVTADEALVRSRWTADQMYDLEGTLRAGRMFMNARASRLCDVDYHVHCTEGEPYVSDHHVDQVLERYLRRQAVVDELAGRRPAPL